MKFHWAEEAVITETVPASRTNPGWLALRALRIGAINYHVQRKLARTTVVAGEAVAKMLALLPLSLLRAVRLVHAGAQGADRDAPDRSSPPAARWRRSASSRNPTKPRRSCLEPTGHHVRVARHRRMKCGVSRCMDVVRGAAFIGTLLLAWISLRPFVDLGNQQLKDTTTGNETPTYLVFGVLAVLMVALAMRDNMRGLATLLTPAFCCSAAGSS